MTKPIARDPIYRGRVFDAEIIVLCVRWYITYLSSAKTRSGRHLFDKVLVMQSGEDRFRAHEVPLPAAVA